MTFLDFTPLFHWNVKMLFAYLVFEYDTPKQPRNQIVIWDKIIRNGDAASLKIKDLQNKYVAADLSVNGLK